MTITKIFNNNCVSVDVDGKEHIVTGSGVGFSTQIGWPVDEDRIEKRFEIIDENRTQFEKMIAYTDVRYVNIARRIIEFAESALNVKVDNKVNISLTDHIAYAMDRYQDGIQFPPLFDDDIQLYYPQEFAIGLKALDLIESSEGIRLPNEEVAYIAMHIINASSLTKMSDFAQRITVFIHDTLKIIEQSEGFALDRNAIEISRLVVHLKYLGHRVLTGQQTPIDEGLETVGNHIIEELSQKRQTVTRVANYIEKNYNYIIDTNESLYLSIHLHQILNKYQSRRGS